MRSSSLSLLFSAVLCAQTAPLPPFGGAPTPPVAVAPVPSDTVVATVAGKPYTAAELDKLIASYPGPVQQAIRSNPRMALSQVLLFKELAGMAEKDNLDKQSPNKEMIEFQRMQFLAQAEINAYRYSFNIPMEEVQKFYKEHPDDYRQAKVSVIYIAFTPAGATSTAATKLTEAEAKVKATDLRAKILAGGDFAALARENSDDKASAEKGGDFGIVTRTSSYPDAVKSAVFALKVGGVSEPVRETNGFYLVRVDGFTPEPFEQVSFAISERIRQDRFNEWLKGIQNKLAVKVENENYFMPRAVAPPQQQPPAQPVVPKSAQ